MKHVKSLNKPMNSNLEKKWMWRMSDIMPVSM